MNCPKCNEEMEQGVQLDQSYGLLLKPIWIEGKDIPDSTVRLFRKFPAKLRGGSRFFVDSYRCRACGFLESYAIEKA